MKILVKDYTYNPELKRIYLNKSFIQKHPNISTESWLIVTNLTTGDTLYQFNEVALGGTYIYNYMQLNAEVSVFQFMASTDKLQIFLDVPPAIHIKGDDGQFLGSTDAPLIVSPEDLFSTFRGIHKELRKMNLHLESMTDLNLTNRDLDGER
jgi:hypothetical protein